MTHSVREIYSNICGFFFFFQNDYSQHTRKQYCWNNNEILFPFTNADGLYTFAVKTFFTIYWFPSTTGSEETVEFCKPNTIKAAIFVSKWSSSSIKKRIVSKMSSKKRLQSSHLKYWKSFALLNVAWMRFPNRILSQICI